MIKHEDPCRVFLLQYNKETFWTGRKNVPRTTPSRHMQCMPWHTTPSSFLLFCSALVISDFHFCSVYPPHPFIRSFHLLPSILSPTHQQLLGHPRLQQKSKALKGNNTQSLRDEVPSSPNLTTERSFDFPNPSATQKKGNKKEKRNRTTMAKVLR